MDAEKLWNPAEIMTGFVYQKMREMREMTEAWRRFQPTLMELMPDVGEVLGDASLAETIPDLKVDHISGGTFQPESIEEGGGVYGYRRRVFHVQRIDRISHESFTSLSPPPSHLLLHVNFNIPNIDTLAKSLSSPHLSCLAFSIPRFGAHSFPSMLCELLRNLPPSCPLRSLLVHCKITGIEDEREAAEFVDAFCESPARNLDCLSLHVSSTQLSFQQLASKLQGKCRSLFLCFTRRSCTVAEYANILLAFMPRTDHGGLQELGLRVEGGRGEFHELLTADPELHRALKGIESCKLKRLDMRGMPPVGPGGMRLLVASLASPECSVQDLGISLASTPHLHHTRLLTFAQAFQCGPSLSKLKVLRFDGIDTEEAAACVVDILGSPESNCKVRFLDLHVSYMYDEDQEYEPFFKKCQLAARPPRIECLRVAIDNCIERQFHTELACLADFLSRQHCSLLWLEFQYVWDLYPIRIPEPLQMDVANSLEANTLLTHLSLSGFTSPAARSRAATFLARNRLYQAMGLSKDDCMKPQMARLFLCGHGEVGKTTLRKALLKIHRKHPASSSNSTDHLSQANHQYGFGFNMCSDQPCRRRTSDQQRTRGLEIHQLHFDSTQRIAIFDLGGQSDYHVFHHFFLTNTSQDLFILVCKYTPHSTQASQVVSDLEYWLRFIVSHRNSVRGPNPKIMLVVNFFNISTHARSSDHLAEGNDEFMRETAFSFTQGLREKYARQLDFGSPTHHVFGIVATDARQARPILEMLRMLLVDLLNQRLMIPKLCDELMSTTLPLLARDASTQQPHACGFGRRLRYGATRAGRRGFHRVIVDYEEVKEKCVQAHQAEGCDASKFERRTQGALTELHNVGELIFFPPVDMPHEQVKTITIDEGEASCTDPMLQTRSAHSNAVGSGQGPTNRDEGKMSPIIVDPNWFCNKVVGSLLAPQWLSGRVSRFEWTYVDIKQFLIESGCSKQYVGEVLRYMLSLGLCFSLADKYFFPAMATQKELRWPPNFISHKVHADSFHFYGRRIKCKDSERHLIPSGVFARLQVKLQSFYGQGYKLGYHWASFVKERVSVMVRFGRFTIVDDGESIVEQSLKLPIHMVEDDHPEWIDILLCCPSSQDSRLQGTSAEYTVMQHVKKLIFDICQATSRGIPTVALEECALRHEAVESVMQLEVIEESIRGHKGLASYVVWQDQHSTSVVDLLLPEELEPHVARHVQAIQQIQDEFTVGMIPHTEGEGDSTSHEIVNKDGEGDPQLNGEFKVLYESLMDRGFAMLGAQVNNVLAEVKDIKRDVHKLMQGLQQAEVNIVAQCSTRLLEQLHVQGVLPVYPYFTDSKGKMQRLRNFLQGKKAIVHFLCESHAEGPHIVEGQLGREVIVERGMLMKWAPFLIPSLMVMCCAARFAANAFLPGVAPLIFDPFMHFLNSIGINKEDLQSQIMPKALDAIFDELNLKIQGLYDKKKPFISINREQQKEGLEALQGVLGSIEGLDMNKDFGLHLVKVGPKKAQWLCSNHTKEHEKLTHPENPFRKTVK